MKKTLLILGAMLLSLGAMAQEVTLNFTTNDWGLPEGSSNKGKDSKEFTNGTYTITLAAADGYYFNSSGYLMLGKKGSTLTFPTFDFDVEKIEVVGREGASASTAQNIYVGETAVSTETKGATGTNTYEIAADYQKAGNVYVLKVTSSHNTQITTINIYKKGVTTLADAELKFSQDSYAIEKGQDFTAPTFTKATDATVTFTSDNEEVATVSADGVISLAGGVGTATITAESEATAAYKAGKATATIKVYEADLYKKATAVESGKEYIIAVIGDDLNPIAAANSTKNYGYLDVANSRLTSDGIYAEKGNGFVIESTDGGYTIKQTSNNKYLYMKGTYNSFNFDAAPTEGHVWTIEAQADGTFKITNVAMSKYIQYSAQYTSYGSYDTEKGSLPYLYVLDDTANGISNTVAEKTINANAPIYNLAGQQVSKSYKGVVIQNGRKFIQK